MSKLLPKIQNPIFELELPSTGEKIRYRTFTVREEKILLLAQESKDINQSILAMKQVVNNCLIELDAETLPTFDLEYILLTLRSKSVDNNVKFSITDNETEERIDLELDLKDISVTFPEGHSKLIKINDDYTLIMRYPTVNEFQKLVEGGIDSKENIYDIMIACMDKLVNGDDVTLLSEFEPEAVDEFAQDLSSDVIQKIKTFFETAPKLRHELKYTNSAGTEKTFVIEGMETFFI